MSRMLELGDLMDEESLQASQQSSVLGEAQKPLFVAFYEKLKLGLNRHVLNLNIKHDRVTFSTVLSDTEDIVTVIEWKILSKPEHQYPEYDLLSLEMKVSIKIRNDMLCQPADILAEQTKRSSVQEFNRQADVRQDSNKPMEIFHKEEIKLTAVSKRNKMLNQFSKRILKIVQWVKRVESQMSFGDEIEMSQKRMTMVSESRSLRMESEDEGQSKNDLKGWVSDRYQRLNLNLSSSSGRFSEQKLQSFPSSFRDNLGNIEKMIKSNRPTQITWQKQSSKMIFASPEKCDRKKAEAKNSKEQFFRDVIFTHVQSEVQTPVSGANGKIDFLKVFASVYPTCFQSRPFDQGQQKGLRKYTYSKSTDTPMILAKKSCLNASKESYAFKAFRNENKFLVEMGSSQSIYLCRSYNLIQYPAHNNLPLKNLGSHSQSQESYYLDRHKTIAEKFNNDQNKFDLLDFLYGAWQMLKAVQDLQDQKFLHRDLKIGNMLIDENGVIKLIDFGSACAIGFLNGQQNSKRQEFEKWSLKQIASTFYIVKSEYKGNPIGDYHQGDIRRNQSKNFKALRQNKRQIFQKQCYSTYTNYCSHQKFDLFAIGCILIENYRHMDNRNPGKYKNNPEVTKRIDHLIEGLMRIEYEQRLSTKEALYQVESMIRMFRRY